MNRRERRMVIGYTVTLLALGGVLAWFIAQCQC